MKNPEFSDELTQQFNELNAKLEWKPGVHFVTVEQKSDSNFVPGWSEKCKSAVSRFFQRFRRESYEISADIKDSARKGLGELKNNLQSLRADCWISSNNRYLILVGLKENISSSVKLVEAFIQNARDENDKPKEIVRFVQVSADHSDYLQHTQFLDTLRQSHSGLSEAIFTNEGNQIQLKGPSEVVTSAEQTYKDVVKTLEVFELEMPIEAVDFLSEKIGLDFIEERLTESDIVSIILVESKTCVKIVAKSFEECEAAKKCLCSNVRQATIDLPSAIHDILFSSKKWYDIARSMDSEELLKYNIIPSGESKQGYVIKLNGATDVVEEYDRKVTNFVNSQKVESFEKSLVPGVSRYMKENLGREVGKIEADLKEEQVKIVIGSRNFTCTGTKDGINETKKRMLVLENDIITKSVDYSKIGVQNLFISEGGVQNIKGIEVVRNVKIEVIMTEKALPKYCSDVIAKQVEKEDYKSATSQVAGIPSDPFNQCNFTTSEGLDVSWKYGNIAQESVSILQP